jgi:EAL domain-containing protein (putative c-di-GMP-specific phosphodiesterase class I)
MAAAGARQQQLARDLRAAVHHPDENFHLLFQPQIDMRTGKLLAAEALLRWRSPDGTNVPPAQFVPMASDNGLIPALGRWVLREACRTVAMWRTRVPAVVAVNVDARQLHEGFAEQVAATLRHTGAEPHWLIVEVTESAAMGGAAQDQLERIRALGVGISIDDFGTGFSSLSRLTELPAQQVKIDRAFVTGLDGSAGKLEIVRTIVALADTLGLQTLAEGVESPEQAAALLHEGITAAQGYVYSPPVDADRCEDLWRSGVGLPQRVSG